MIKAIVTVACVMLANQLSSVMGEDALPILPGHDITIDQTVPFCDSIVVAKMMKLGEGMLRMPGYITFHDNEFKIIRSLKGTLKGDVKIWFFLDDKHASKPPKEMENYIVMSYFREDQNRVAYKMLAANEKNEKDVAYAIDAARGEIVLKFTSYDAINGKTGFHIERLDVKVPNEILEIGQNVPGTKYQLTKLIPKGRPVTHEGKDTSELTLVHSETGRVVILILDKAVGIRSPDSPESNDIK